jgi:uncharacterized protein (TIGR03435 family)
MHRALFAFGLCVTAAAQPAPKFEVVSVKPCTQSEPAAGRKGGRGGGTDWSPGRLTVRCQTVDNLIRNAYLSFAAGRQAIDPENGMPAPSVSPRVWQQDIKGSPAWIRSQRYTIQAKSDAPATHDMMLGPMMQRLLEDRFQLKLHREAREVPVYELIVAKGGARLTLSKPESCLRLDLSKGPPPLPPGPVERPFCGFYRFDPNTGTETLGQTMRGLCIQFSAWLDRDVIDKTGLTGAFDIRLDLSPQEVMPNLRRSDAGDDQAAPAPPGDPAGAVFRAVQKLGLKLEPAKTNGEFLVIDHVERPAEN